MNITPQQLEFEVRDTLVAIANAIGLEVGPYTTPHEVLVSVQGYVETHKDTLEELAYARNALVDLGEKVTNLENQVAGLRNRPAPQHDPYPSAMRRDVYRETVGAVVLDVPDVVYDPAHHR